MATDTVEEKYVTIFDEDVKVHSYRASKEFTLEWTTPEFHPSNFKLKCRHDDYSDYYNLFVNAIFSRDVKVKVTKHDICYASHLPQGTPDQRDVLLKAGEKFTSWNFAMHNRQSATANQNWDQYFYNFWLKIEFSVPQPPPITPLELVEPPPAKFDNLFNDRAFSDFQVCAQNTKFHVSKAVLAANSPIFKSKITEEADLNSSNSVTISKFKAAVVEKMLRFMYNNKVPLDDDLEIITDLLTIAHEYQIEELKARCEKVILENISVEMVYRYAGVAERCNAAKLQEACVNFICARYNELEKSDEFKMLVKDFPTLTIAICAKLRDEAKEGGVLKF